MKRQISQYAMIMLLGLSMVWFTGCAASRESALDKKKIETIGKATKQGDFEKGWADAEASWALRLDEAKLKEAIDKFEKLANVSSPNLTPEQRKDKLVALYVRVARGYYLMADSHIRLKAEDDELDDEMMKVFNKGVTAAEKAIAIADPAFAKKIAEDPRSWQANVVKTDKKALPALYWYATNLGKWALLEGITTILARKDDIKVTMDYMIANDPGYFYGAPHRYFAVYHTKVPIGGGNPPESKKSFDKSLEIAPNYFATRVLYAETYARLTRDAKLFEAQLKKVIETPATTVPELTPENTLEQRKAKKLLAKKDDLFY